MNHWRKSLWAALLAVVMLAGSLAGALAEGTAVVAELDVEEEPVLLVSVNGEEIWSNNAEMQDLINYYTSFYASYGYDTSDASLQAYLKMAGLQWAIETVLYEQKARELGIAEFSEEELAELEATAKETWNGIVEQYTTYLTELPEEPTEEELAAARVKALSYIETNYGYTEESYIAESMSSSMEVQLRQRVQDAVLGTFEVTEEELAEYFNSLVEEDKGTYEGNVPTYEYYTQYMGSDSYYIPEGYRGITHILLEVDDDLMNNYTSLAAQLEEQQEAETADESTEEGEGAEATEETAEEAETAETAEASEDAETGEAAEASEGAEAAEETTPVTQEMVDAARQAILDSVQATVDEIKAKYEAGTPFADLIAEYGTDPGMTVEPAKSEGYMVHEDSILWDPAFTEGAMTLKEVGDISEPVLGSYGIHILHYTRDIPGGAVELTEELREQLTEEILSEKESEAVTAMVEGWIAEAEIVYTDEGQAIVDAANGDAEEESVETTEATEEALADEDE